MSRVLVTGGEGFIGRALCARLHELGHEVTSFDSRDRKDAKWQTGTPWRNINGNILDCESVRNAVRGADVVLHLAAVNGTGTFYSEPFRVLEVGTSGTLNVARACLDFGTSKVMFFSSSEVYGEPTLVPTPEDVPLVIPDATNCRFSYSSGKIISEVAASCLFQSGISATVVRPHNVYGPNMGRLHAIPQLTMKILDAVRKSGGRVPAQVPIQGTGLETRAYCFISDFVAAFEILFKKDCRGTYNIGTESETTSLQLALRIARVLKAEVELTTLKEALPEGSPTRRVPDISRLKALGFEPKISLDVGLQTTVNWYMDNEPAGLDETERG